MAPKAGTDPADKRNVNEFLNDTALENPHQKQNRNREYDMTPTAGRSQLASVGWLIRSVVTIVALLCLVPEAGLLAGDGSSTELRVNVTIAPTPCRYPEPCAPPPAGAATRLVVSDSVIRYVGSPPLVVRSRGMLSILF